MSDINYNKIISELNQRNNWVSHRIKLTISLNQYIAILKGYQPHWDMRYGLIYKHDK